MIRRVMGGVGANIFDKSVIAIMQLAVVPVLVLHWGVHLYGVWVVLATIPSFLAFGDFGFATAAGTTMTMHIAVGERSEAARIFAVARTAISFAAAAMIALGVLIAFLLPKSLFDATAGFSVMQMRVTIALLLTYGIVCLQNSTSVAAFRACGLLPVGTLFHAMTYLSENLMVMLTVADGASPIGAAGALLGTRAVGVMIQRVTLLRIVPWINQPLALDWPLTKELLKPAKAVMVLPIANALLLQGTAVALSVSASAAIVPIFTTARTLSRVGLQMTNLFSTALMPEFSGASARGDRVAQATILTISVLSTAVMVIPFAFVLAFFGPAIIKVWTHGAIHTPPMLMWIMAGSTLLSGFWYSLSSLLLALNWQARYAYAFLVCSAVSVALSYGFSLYYGAAGAGLAMLCVDVAMAIVIARLLGRLPIGLDAVIAVFRNGLSLKLLKTVRARSR